MVTLYYSGISDMDKPEVGERIVAAVVACWFAGMLGVLATSIVLGW